MTRPPRHPLAGVPRAALPVLAYAFAALGYACAVVGYVVLGPVVACARRAATVPPPASPHGLPPSAPSAALRVVPRVPAPPPPAWAPCVAGADRCNGDRPEVCRGEGADAAWWPVMGPALRAGGASRPLACGDHGAVCSVEPDGTAVCVVTGDGQ